MLNNKNTKIVVVTGRISTGKSTLLNMFKDLGYKTISADDVFKKIKQTENHPAHIEFCNIMGDYYLKDNILNNNILVNAINKNKKILTILSLIYGPYISDEINNEIEKIQNVSNNSNKYRFVFVEIPVFFDNPYSFKHDFIISTVLDDDTLRKRAIARGVNAIMLENILAMQPKNSVFLDKSDICVDTKDVITFNKIEDIISMLQLLSR